MESKKQFIKNRKNQKIAVLTNIPEKVNGLVFVMHGLGGFKEQAFIQMVSKIFLKNNYISVLFDATNSSGESDGVYEDATATNYYEDLEDVIEWASAQTWYCEPFILVGHSLGSLSAALFAEKFPQKIKALAPISTVVSGKFSVEAHKKYIPDQFKQWEKTGWLSEESKSKPGVMRSLKWSHVIDRLQYDLMTNVDKLNMPTLMMLGELDEHTPLEHQKILYDKLPGKKELHVIKGSSHTFREQKHLEEIEKIFDNWIKKL